MLRIDDKVIVRSLEHTTRRDWQTKEKVATINHIYTVCKIYSFEPAVRLSNTYVYHIKDLVKVNENSPYKDTNLIPQLFDINNLCEV